MGITPWGAGVLGSSADQWWQGSTAGACVRRGCAVLDAVTPVVGGAGRGLRSPFEWCLRSQKLGRRALKLFVFIFLGDEFYSCVHACVYAYKCVRIYTCVCTHMCTYVCVCGYMCVCACVCVFTQPAFSEALHDE